MSRVFSTSQRWALYMAADGLCEMCGRELDVGWHADHVVPWTRGGPTDVRNGQALCPECNISKGSNMSMFEPRKWQQEFITAYGMADKKEFLAVASVGSGKTHATMHLLAQMPTRKMLVVVPKLNVLNGWCAAAQKHGINAHPGYGPGVKHKLGLSGDTYRVVVVTYQALASAPDSYRSLTARGDWLVVFDEIHHLDTDSGAWGEAAERAFKTNGDVSDNIRTLGLSGTPWRTDGTRIPFVPYDGDRVAPDYIYNYAAAVADRVVRKPQFVAIDADAKIMGPEGFKDLKVEDARGEEIPRVIRSAVHHESDWLHRAIETGYEMVLEDRANLVPDAAMIIHTKDKETADEVADVSKLITGADAEVIVSSTRDSGAAAAEKIKLFASSTKPIMVAVNMANEGTDVPRLTVGIHATNVRTRMDFEQRFGRLVRLTDAELADGARHAVAKYIIPAAEPHVEFARSIYDEVFELLRDKVTGTGPDDEDNPGPPPPPPSPVLPASNADVSSIYSDGELITDKETWRIAGGLAARLGNEYDQGYLYRELKMVEQSTQTREPSGPPPDLKKRETQMRKELNQSVKSFAKEFYWDGNPKNFGRGISAAWNDVKDAANLRGDMPLDSYRIEQLEAGMAAVSRLRGRKAGIAV